MELIFSTGVLQRIDRQARVSVGDILTYGYTARLGGRTVGDVAMLDREVYTPHGWQRLIPDRLEATHGVATVYCWLIQGLAQEDAERLNAALSDDEGYLGAFEVSFANPLQLQFFRNSLITRYRIGRGNLTELFSMDEGEDPDLAIKEMAEKASMSVDYEDYGARQTFFDKYDTIEHFRKVEDFKRVFGRFAGMTPDRAGALTLSLEELHPKVFSALSAAARAVEAAQDEEGLAQAALSARRLLEQIADYLFPPRSQMVDGRKIGRAEYKNRLWAYIKLALQAENKPTEPTLTRLGKEADRLIERFNAGLHANMSQKTVELALSDLARWLSEVLDISPSQARKPYLAFEQEMSDFVRPADGT
ncbi:MAG: hypothetical protein EON87_10495 [Brevundimonas sp.]|nr:MAG: hypothetical protein EON87_10495 [Brevundimonas sp.]